MGRTANQSAAVDKIGRCTVRFKVIHTNINIYVCKRTPAETHIHIHIHTHARAHTQYKPPLLCIIEKNSTHHLRNYHVNNGNLKASSPILYHMKPQGGVVLSQSSMGSWHGCMDDCFERRYRIMFFMGEY